MIYDFGSFFLAVFPLEITRFHQLIGDSANGSCQSRDSMSCKLGCSRKNASVVGGRFPSSGGVCTTKYAPAAANRIQTAPAPTFEEDCFDSGMTTTLATTNENNA
jgi:hypothetical protein